VPERAAPEARPAPLMSSVTNKERRTWYPGCMGDRRIVLAVMCVGYFLVLLDVTIVNVALPSIATSLGASVSDLQWVVDGYAIALASIMLLAGTAGDLYGHRRVVMTGLVVFGVGSLGCGVAPDPSVLVAARVVQGVGAALLLPGTLAIVTRAFPDGGERAKAIGIWAAIGSAALPAGPLVGGALVDLIGWRAVFFINLPIVVAASLVVTQVVAESRGAPDRRLDHAGAGLGALLLGAITFAFIDAGRTGLGGPTIVAAVAAVGLLFAFITVERSRNDPVLPLALFRRPAFTVANAAAGAMNLGTLGALFLLTLYLQQVRDLSPLTAGVALLPLFLPLSLLAPLAGRLTARLGPKVPMAAGLALAAAGLALLARLDVDSGYLVLVPAILLWGVGLAALTPAVVAAAMGAVEPTRAGLASAVNNTARQAGGAVGIAAFGALAGSPTDRHAFMGGLHAAGLIAAGLYLVAALTTLALVGSGRRRAVRVGPVILGR
jgi:MFS transporter, DHA2 family, methylenomycin A resistance protein